MRHVAEGTPAYPGGVISVPSARGARQRLVIERVVAGGDGLARASDGRVVFVPGALPGETVDVDIVQSKRDFARGRLIEVIDASPRRTVAPCAAFGRGCGGCDWQQADAAAQLEWKAEIVREALRRTAKRPDLAESVTVGGQVPPWGYRTSMRMALDGNGRVSLRRQRSNDAVLVDACSIAHPSLESMFPSLRILGADEVSLRVSVATGEATAWWTPADVAAFGLADSVGQGASATVTERVGGHDFRVSAASFFQSGPDAAELLIHTVRGVCQDHLDTAVHVVDAYGGVGLFAATMVGGGTAVTLVEGSASACADARVNLLGRNANVVESALETWTPIPADVVIADPARTGLGAEAAARLAACGASTIVLVSCDPVAMARDTGLLEGGGYRLDAAVVLDLFPQTHHVEVVTRFVR